MKIFNLSTFLLLLCSVLHVQAQDETWSLEECLEYAEQTNLQLKQFRLQRATSLINLKQARASRLPNLSGSANYGLNTGQTINELTNQRDNLTSNNVILSLSGNVPLFTGLGNLNTIKQRELQLQATEYTVEDAKNDMYLNIANAFLTVLLNQELLEQNQLQVASTREQRDRTSRLVKAGSLAQSDLLELEAQLATDQTNVVQSRNDLEIAYLGLQQLLDIDPSQPFQVEEPEIDTELTEPLHPASSRGIYEYAAENQPDVIGADVSIEANNLAIKAAKGARYPSLFGSYRANTRYVHVEIEGLTIENDPFFDQFRENREFALGLGLNIPIYNNRLIRSDIERAEIGLRDAEIQAQIVRQQLRQNIEQAYVDAVTSFSQFQQTREQIRNLQLVYDNAKRQFEVGLINSTDFVIAQNNLQRAELNQIQNKYQYIFNVKVLNFYQGEELGF